MRKRKRRRRKLGAEEEEAAKEELLPWAALADADVPMWCCGGPRQAQ
jgi:hypothetical protein